MEECGCARATDINQPSKNRALLTRATVCLNLVGIVLSKISQEQTEKILYDSTDTQCLVESNSLRQDVEWEFQGPKAGESGEFRLTGVELPFGKMRMF